MLASVVVVRGRRSVGFGDREARFVGGEEVPVTTNKQRTVKWLREGVSSVVLHCSGNSSSLRGGTVLIVNVPGNRGGVKKGREAKAEGAARNGLGVVNVKVGEGGRLGFSNEDSNTSLIWVKGEGGEEMEGIVDGAQGKGKGLKGTVDFL